MATEPTATEYPKAWSDAIGVTQVAHAVEPVTVALDAYVASMTDAEFADLVSRTRR